MIHTALSPQDATFPWELTLVLSRDIEPHSKLFRAQRISNLPDTVNEKKVDVTARLGETGRVEQSDLLRHLLGLVEM